MTRDEASAKALKEVRLAHGIAPVSPDPAGWTCLGCGAGVTAIDVGKIDSTLTNDEWRRFGAAQSRWSRHPLDQVYEHRHHEVNHVDHPMHSDRGTVRAVHPEIQTLGREEAAALMTEWRRLARRYEREVQP